MNHFIGPENARILILSELLALYLCTLLMRIIMPLLSTRLKSHPQRRQQQLYTLIPVLILKSTVVYLLLSTVDFSWLHNKSLNGDLTAEGAQALQSKVEYQFQVWFAMSICYVFEVLHRPCSLELAAHHILLQSLNFYYWLYVRNFLFADVSKAKDGTEPGLWTMTHATAGIRGYAAVMQFFVLMIIFGPGITDGFSNLTFLFYYTTTSTEQGSRILIRASSSAATVARGFQWMVLFGFIGCHWDLLMQTLGWLERGSFMIAIALWFWTEVDEIRKLRGMTRKFMGMLKEDKAIRKMPVTGGHSKTRNTPPSDTRC